MKKGKYGIVLAFYAVLAFALVILRQPFICALLMLVAVILEKDEWLSRQTIQAFILSILVEFFSMISSALYALPLWWISSFLGGLFSFISGIVFILAIIFSIIAITKVVKEQDAAVPVIADIAYRAYGKVRPTPPPPAPPVPPHNFQGYPQPPAGNPNQTGNSNTYQYPQPPVAPVAPQPPTAAETPVPETQTTEEAPAADNTENNENN